METASLNGRSSRSSTSSGSQPSKHVSMTDIKVPLTKPLTRLSSVIPAVSDVDSANTSGVSGTSEDPSSFGYVAAPSLQPTVSNSSSGSSNTGDTGYISQDTGYTSQPSYSQSPDASGISAGSSGFSEMDSPEILRRPKKVFVDKKLRYSESDEDPLRSKYVESDFDDRSPLSSGQASPVIATKRLLDLTKCKVSPDEISGKCLMDGH